MTTATTAAPTTTRATGTTARTRLTALGRAELTLLARNRTAIFVALFMPAAMIMAMKSTFEKLDLKGTGLTVAGAALVGGIGTVLIQAVYMNLVAAYVARREELVLKRLRTGEVTDGEILAGTALPAGALALAQSAVIVAAGTAFFGLGAPERPELLVAGLLLGVVLLTALAAVTSVGTRTVQTAQLTTLPLFLVSMMGSGLFVPLEIFPDRLAQGCELLPLTGVMTLVRAGWLGGAGGTELLGAALTGLVWTAVAVFAVQRWFRWDPRR
ncbi:ABC transporter permease [Streptomyces sp. A0958]|uniref:ABC transporter permease n=1 Tax=Streptomyces sp. A0958 TaxID=2563101 RepID=UPI00109E4D65|nr:ABC transporter permease [Streptomyces sp. A0958]THA60400.1 ABC transporter permease [Streptomyces sp. A0958]